MASTNARKASGVGRRVMSVITDDRQDPPVLLREQYEARGPLRLGTDGDQLLAQRAGAQAQVSGGVHQVDVEPLFAGVGRSRSSPTTPWHGRPPVASTIRSARMVSSTPAERRIGRWWQSSKACAGPPYWIRRNRIYTGGRVRKRRRSGYCMAGAVGRSTALKQKSRRRSASANWGQSGQPGGVRTLCS
jgi:hypothetical protein